MANQSVGENGGGGGAGQNGNSGADASNNKEDQKQTPGFGWSNGSIPPSFFPHTRDGKVSLYKTERRLINLRQSWTRIGDGEAHDAVHSKSGGGPAEDVSLEEEGHVKKSLIAQLCEKFYNHGWATGTGGGLSIRVGGPSENRPWRVFVAPSGVQKEDMIGEDVFELDMDQNIISPPTTPGLKLSACTPLWYVVYRNRPTARCVIHTHSIRAQMATLLDPTETSETLRITHLEMLKGVGNHAYDDVLEIPIIDNRPTEDQLADQLEATINKYPKANAILVRRHGLYAWGDSWEQAKTQCESFDYLFESAIKMRSIGMDFSAKPKSGTYRVPSWKGPPTGTQQDAEMNEGGGENGGSRRKRPRLLTKSSSLHGPTGFNDASDRNNDADLARTPTTIPLVPRDSKVLLLDIEGCTTSISSVKDELFPYVLKHIDRTVDEMADEKVRPLLDALAEDVTNIPDKEIEQKCLDALPNFSKTIVSSMREAIKACVKIMVKLDVKATGLKKLQGEMWEAGYKTGQLRGHVYPDFKPLLQWCGANDVAVNIYSSGSVRAQKLLFGHSVEGDLTPHLSEHFDTSNAGPKKVKDSYVKIASALGVSPEDVVFVSDAEGELVAAREAGIGFPVMSVRPGNAPMTDVGRTFPVVHSLMQLCGS